MGWLTKNTENSCGSICCNGIFLSTENSFQLVKNECDKCCLCMFPDPKLDLVFSHYNLDLSVQFCQSYLKGIMSPKSQIEF